MSEADLDQRTVIEYLWREYLVARQYKAGSGNELLKDVFGRKNTRRFGAPRWFVMVELGMGRDQGPNYFAVTHRLRRDNRKRARQFNVEDDRQLRASLPVLLKRTWGEEPVRKRRRRRKRVPTKGAAA
jgi:hypothetical protein